MTTNFGEPRPGAGPPPRQPLTAEEIKFRETFTRAGHLAGQPQPEPGASSSTSTTASTNKLFDESAIRTALQQEGMDFAFQIFPIGEKPQEGVGSGQWRENRITELESERSVMRNRMLTAESAAASAIRELNELQVKFDTLRSDMELLKAESSQKPAKKERKQEPVNG